MNKYLTFGNLLWYAVVLATIAFASKFFADYLQDASGVSSVASVVIFLLVLVIKAGLSHSEREELENTRANALIQLKYQVQANKTLQNRVDELAKDMQTLVQNMQELEKLNANLKEGEKVLVQRWNKEREARNLQEQTIKDLTFALSKVQKENEVLVQKAQELPDEILQKMQELEEQVQTLQAENLSLKRSKAALTRHSKEVA